MNEKVQYNGLDILKILMAVLVASRHMIQVFFLPDSRWQTLIVAWLSNLAVPVFFIISGFFLFNKTADKEQKRRCGGRDTVFLYCKKILVLYLIWSVLYIPVCAANWRFWGADTGERLRVFLQLFFFSSAVPQLWYLPALALACLIVWFFCSRGVKPWVFLIITGLLFTAGCIGDNWYLNQQLPGWLRHILALYCRYFLTMRNGVFYGAFFVCLGLCFSRYRWRMSFLPAVAGAAGSLCLMYLEVKHFYNTNMVFSTAPAAFFLFLAASAVKLKNRKLYPRLRGMSEWIYLFHFYLFYIFSWTSGLNPIPFTERNTVIMVMGSLLLFSYAMVRLSERPPFKWLKKLI